MSSENPYAAPQTMAVDPATSVPEAVRKKIRNGWIAALVSAGATLVVTLIAMSGTAILGFSAWELFDVALVLGLAFGICKKSRTCAVLMLLYFIASKILIIVETGKPTGMLMALVFGYFFWQAVAGTFAYHKINKPALDVVSVDE